jgi:hypothetical protein
MFYQVGTDKGVVHLNPWHVASVVHRGTTLDVAMSNGEHFIVSGEEISGFFINLAQAALWRERLEREEAAG